MRPPASLFDQVEPEDAESTASEKPTLDLPPAPTKKRSTRSDTDRVTVTQLASMIGSVLKSELPARLNVVGEISGFKDMTHWYFRLKDAGAVIDCVMFASAVKRMAAAPRDGDEVLACGRIEHYAKNGRTQLYVDRIEPIGAGALEQKFRALCREIQALGWFDPAIKNPPPRFPRRVAVVTSRTSAAAADVIDTFRRRAPFVPLLLVDVRVQGESAAGQIARALDRLNRRQAELGIDAILLTRGGGSIEDLWAFNERLVANAIHRSDLPVVAAIGHESDTTIAELVADERAATPTQAAMRLSPDRAALSEQVETLCARLRSNIERLLARDKQRLGSAARRPFFAAPASLTLRHRARLDSTARSLASTMRSRLDQERIRLGEKNMALVRQRPEAVIAARRAKANELRRRLRGSLDHLLERRRAALRQLRRTLEATGPMNVLRRGYSVTFREDGRLVRSESDVAEGDLLLTRLADGRIISTVGDHTANQSDPTSDEPDLFRGRENR